MCVCNTVFQALKADLVPYLLKLLEGIGLENLDSPAATKAQIVKALKAMTRSLQHGEQVSRTDLPVQQGVLKAKGLGQG